MCARYNLIATAEELIKFFRLDRGLQLVPHYNIAPGQPVLAIRGSPTGKREPAFLRWGLIPSWAKDPVLGNRMINARAETVADKSSFRSAFRYRRCLIPASGFYEWQKPVAGDPHKPGQGTRASKQPYLLRPTRDPVFALAGLWEQWQAPDGTELETCSILTMESNAQVMPIHDRMPVILPGKHFEAWLDPHQQQPKAITALIQPVPDGLIETVAITTHVNNPRHDDLACLLPAYQQSE